MTPEEKSLLEETHALAAESAEILRSMQKTQRIHTAFKIFYWVAVIALSLGAYYLIQPYVNTLKASVDEITGGASDVLKY